MDIGQLLGRCTFPEPGTRVSCGVSGGADSLALLSLACRSGCEATAVFVDHGLRAEAAQEAVVVERACGVLGAAFRRVEVKVEPGGNLEARARAARHGVLGGDALLGHTMDDQAETVILAMMRGAAVHGLAGMRPDRRPILGLRRTETLGVCAELGLYPVEDPTNSDPRFTRNRVRHEVIPLLCDVARRDIVPVIARQAALMRDVADHLDSEVADVDPTDVHALAQLPEVLLRLVLRGWLSSSSVERHPPDSAAIERVVDVVKGMSVGTEIPGGYAVRRSAQRLRMTKVAGEVPADGHEGSSPQCHEGK